MTDGEHTLAAVLLGIHQETTWTWRNEYNLVTATKQGCIECGANRPAHAVSWPCRTVALIEALEADENDKAHRAAVRAAIDAQGGAGA